MAGMKVPLSLPSLSGSHRVAAGGQIGSDISAVTCYRHGSGALNQNVRAHTRAFLPGVGRPGGGLIGVCHCPLLIEECHPPCLWHFPWQPCFTQGQS